MQPSSSFVFIAWRRRKEWWHLFCGRVIQALHQSTLSFYLSIFCFSLSFSFIFSLPFPLPTPLSPSVPPFTYSVFPSSLFSLYIASTSIPVLLLPSLPLNSPSPPPALSLANDNHCISSTQKPSSVKSDTSRCANRAAPL